MAAWKNLNWRTARCSSEEAAKPATLLHLSDAEIKTYRSLHTPKRRKDWLTGRIAAKRLIVEHYFCQGIRLKMTEVEIANTSAGVPYARLPSRVTGLVPSISISHSAWGGVAALSLSGGLIGIDSEAIACRPAAFLSTVAHTSEWSPALKTAQEQTRLWTLKEAVSKALGVGLSVGFWDIRFVPASRAQNPEKSLERNLELYGKARVKWQEFGSPQIFFESLMEPDTALSLAYTDAIFGKEEAHA